MANPKRPTKSGGTRGRATKQQREKPGGGFESFITAALRDKDLREKLRKDPETVAAQYSLSKEDRDRLSRIEPGRLDQLAWEIEEALAKAVSCLNDGRCM